MITYNNAVFTIATMKMLSDADRKRLNLTRFAYPRYVNILNNLAEASYGVEALAKYGLLNYIKKDLSQELQYWTKQYCDDYWGGFERRAQCGEAVDHLLQSYAAKVYFKDLSKMIVDTVCTNKLSDPEWYEPVHLDKVINLILRKTMIKNEGNEYE